jgi:hypothetical protein
MGDRRAKDDVGGEGVTSDWLGWVVACLVVAVGTSGAARDGDGRGGVGAEGGSGDGGGDRGGRWWWSVMFAQPRELALGPIY